MTDRASKPEPHPGVAALAIAGMGLVVALVLALGGLTERLDAEIGRAIAGFGLAGEPRQLPGWWIWTWTVCLTVAISQAMLHVVGHWRRALLAALAAVVALGWVPVLALASYRVPLGVPLVALAWTVVGSLFYAVRHREPR